MIRRKMEFATKEPERVRACCGYCMMGREFTADEYEECNSFDLWCDWLDQPVKHSDTPWSNHCYDLPEDRK